VKEEVSFKRKRGERGLGGDHQVLELYCNDLKSKLSLFRLLWRSERCSLLLRSVVLYCALFVLKITPDAIILAILHVSKVAAFSKRTHS
jgi:hypothetical protein